MTRIYSELNDVTLLSKQERADVINAIKDAVNIIQDKAADSLKALHDAGPLYDGDVPSKGDRDYLIDLGACAKISMKGEQGYNACTYYGDYLIGIIEWLLGREKIK